MKKNKSGIKEKKKSRLNDIARKITTKKGLNINLYFIIFILSVFTAGTLIMSGSLIVIEKLTHNPVTVPNYLTVIIMSILLGVSVTLFTTIIILSPIKKLNDAMTKVSKGDFKVRVETKSKIEEIKNLYDSFNLMAKELESTEILQTDFVSNVSHEFKTPISAISGYTTLLENDNLTTEQKEYVEKIAYNTNRLTELIKGILLLSKIENQAIETKKEKFSLDEQIRQSIVTLEIKWTAKNIDFDIDMDEITYKGNANILMHVWLNLISNAIKFSKDNDVIKISLKKEENQIVFKISDHGPGISDQDIGHIFDKFYQGDASHHSEGNGLGLALVNRIVHLNNGIIEVKNNEDAGCTFKVILPLK